MISLLKGGNFVDLIKIGKYIAGKRKALGMTQKQLAEKLGMSDKSVSKWERGVCLPDVSVYMELCEILGISINEFLAGEDINTENIIEKTDGNLLQVTKDNKHKLKSLKGIIFALAFIAFIALVTLGATIARHSSQPKNYIVPVARDSAEMKTAELLSGTHGTQLFRYYTHDPFETLTIYMSEYQQGQLITKNKAAFIARDNIAPITNGMIVLVPDFPSATLKLIITDDGAKYSANIPILENVPDRAYYGKSATQIHAETPIQHNNEQGLAALIYDKDILSALPIEAMENGNFGAENDYVYYFSIEFGK